jgi:hypothetical protein
VEKGAVHAPAHPQTLYAYCLQLGVALPKISKGAYWCRTLEDAGMDSMMLGSTMLLLKFEKCTKIAISFNKHLSTTINFLKHLQCVVEDGEHVYSFAQE